MKQQPGLLDQVRDAIRVRQHSIRTEEAYTQWIRRYILFHNKKHPQDMGESEISSFLTHLVVEKHVSAFTRNQVFSVVAPVQGGAVDRIGLACRR